MASRLTAAVFAALAGVALTGSSHPASAVGCEPVEYADARDWPLDKAIDQYCRSGKLFEIARRSLDERLHAGLLTPSAADRLQAQMAACAKQHELFGRVIQNVHNAPLPSCK